MTNEQKKEFINNINVCLKPGQLADHTKEEVDAFLSTIVKVKHTPAELEYYDSIEELYNTYNKKLENLDKMDIVDWLVNKGTDDKFTVPVENYNFIKDMYDSQKASHARFSKLFEVSKEKYKAEPDNKKCKDEYYHYMRVVKEIEADLEIKKKEYDNCLKEVEKLGKASFDQTKKEYMQVITNAKIYEMVNADISRPRINNETLKYALATLKEAYGTYRNNHSIFGRMFKKVSFTSAAHDYKDFCDVRDAFKKYAGNVINMKDVDAYLDNKITLEAFNSRQAESIANINKPLKTVNFVENHVPSFKNEPVVNNEVVNMTKKTENMDLANKTNEVENKKQLDMSQDVENDKYTEIDEYEYFHIEEDGSVKETGKETTNDAGEYEKELD